MLEPSRPSSSNDEANRPRIRQLFVALTIAFSAPGLASTQLESVPRLIIARDRAAKVSMISRVVNGEVDHERRRVRGVGMALPYRRAMFTITGCPDFASG